MLRGDNERLFVMPIKEILRTLINYVPAHVLRLVAGSVVLGLALMLFLKVVDEVFNLPEATLTWAGVGVTVLFALLLCSKSKIFTEKCLHFGVGFVMIFSVGLASNNVIADMRNSIVIITDHPPEVIDFSEIMLPDG